MTVTIRHNKLKKNILNSTSQKEARMKAGYSESYSNTGQIKKTKGYQKIMKPILEQYEKELQRVLTAMSKKNIKKERYKTLVESADKIQKQIQLLGGKPTENITVIPIYKGKSNV